MRDLLYPNRIGRDSIEVALKVIGVRLVKQQTVHLETGGFPINRSRPDMV